MSRIFRIAVAVCVGLLLNPFVVAVSASNLDLDENAFTYELATDDVIEQRIQNLYSEIDLRLTKDVKKYIVDYTIKYRYAAEDFLGRSSMYFPMFQEVLREKGIPDEIKCLAVVESNLKPNAISPYGAAGLWQFMKSTGKLYDLDQDKYIDERRDPEKSTEAAAEFLLDLFHKYDDWTLALAAYNCGPGNVNKAMRRSGKSDYWSIRKYLPKETQQYIPKLVAIIYVTQYYYAHELEPKSPKIDMHNTTSARVWEGLSFKEISKQSGLDLDVIKHLNPQYIRNYIPEYRGENMLTLPTEELIDLAYSEHTDLEIISETVISKPVEESEIQPVVVVQQEVSDAQEKIDVLKLQSGVGAADLVVMSKSPVELPAIQTAKDIVGITSPSSRRPEFSKQVKKHIVKRIR